MMVKMLMMVMTSRGSYDGDGADAGGVMMVTVSTPTTTVAMFYTAIAHVALAAGRAGPFERATFSSNLEKRALGRS